MMQGDKTAAWTGTGSGGSRAGQKVVGKGGVGWGVVLRGQPRRAISTEWFKARKVGREFVLSADIFMTH